MLFIRVAGRHPLCLTQNALEYSETHNTMEMFNLIFFVADVLTVA